VNRTVRSKQSWWLTDAARLADKHPYTFHKPSSEAVALLQASDEAKLIFRFDSDDPESPNAERMWVEIKQVSGNGFKGVLDNDPVYIKDLSCGDPIEFEERHIIQISIDDPVPSKTDKFLPRCFVTRRILHDGCKIGYLYREEPDCEEDSGWRFMAGDESEEYMDDTDNIFFVSLGAVLREDDSVLDLLGSAAGSSFERDGSAGRFVAIGD